MPRITRLQLFFDILFFLHSLERHVRCFEVRNWKILDDRSRRTIRTSRERRRRRLRFEVRNCGIFDDRSCVTIETLRGFEGCSVLRLEVEKFSPSDRVE